MMKISDNNKEYCESIGKMAKENNIRGKDFSQLNDLGLKMLGIKDSEHRKYILKITNNLLSKSNKLNKNLCVACYDGEAIMALIPCGHLSFCKECFEEWDNNEEHNHQCPSCQASYTASVRVFKGGLAD